MATKKAATKGSGGTKALAKWDERLAALAQVATRTEESTGGGGQFIGTRAGQLTFNGAAIPGNKMNVVVIDHGMGEFSVLAHLRRGSVRVAAAQAIAAGDTVGECGNNGESIVPHLHYQLQLSPQPGQQPIPALFSDFRADTSAMQRGTPTRGQRVSHLRRR